MVYRTPARKAPPAPIPPPCTRRLLAPLAWGVGALVVLCVPLTLLNTLLDPNAGSSSRMERLVPEVDTFETAIAYAMLVTPLVALFVLVRRVVPLWSGLRFLQRVVYVGGLLAMQTVAVGGAEYALFLSRGGLDLFGPTLRASYPGPDGRMAHVYEGSFLGATYDVYVAEKHAITMRRKLQVSRAKLASPPPVVRWNDDGSVGLFDASGARFESEPVPILGLFVRGC